MFTMLKFPILEQVYFSIYYISFDFFYQNVWVQHAIQFSTSVMSHSLRPHGLSTPGFAGHHQLRELAQTHIHRVGDAMQVPYIFS